MNYLSMSGVLGMTSVAAKCRPSRVRKRTTLSLAMETPIVGDGLSILPAAYRHLYAQDT